MKFLKFLNILDEDGTGISWTNVGLVSILIKIMHAPMLDGPSVIALVSLLANYMHKRSVQSKSEPDQP